MSRLPIRVRLTLAFAVVMAVVFSAVGAILYVRLGDTLDERIGDELQSRSAALAEAVRLGDATGVEPSVFRSEEGLAQVLGPGGESLFPAGDRVLSPAELDVARRESVTIDREGFRLRAVPVGESVVVVGEPLDDRDEALRGLLAQLVLVLPFALLVSSAIAYFVAGAALRPVEAMRRQAAEITPAASGRRLPLPRAHDEVFRLGMTLNEMLERLDAALLRERAFVADAGHELRTPLAALKTELELALRQPRSADELGRALRSAADETDRLVQLAEDLLLVARADQGRLPVRPSRVHIDDLFADVVARFDGRALDAGRTVEALAEPGLAVVLDPVRIGQALGNFVDNALRYGSGTIRLRAVDSDELVELHVTDEGEGFPSAFLPFAFERFSRSDEARGRGGSGLGLAIAGAIAAAHGGTAHVANVEGSGADVWLSLPRS